MEAGISTQSEQWDYLLEDDILLITNTIGTDYRKLGRALGLTSTELTEVEFNQLPLQERVYKLIILWKQREGRYATKSCFLAKLRLIERHDIAFELEKPEYEIESLGQGLVIHKTTEQQKSGFTPSPINIDQLPEDQSRSTLLATSLSKEEVKFIADNIGPDLICLGREHELTLTQVTDLDRGKESLLEKAYKMIDLWKQKGISSANKYTMIKALRSIRRVDIADPLAKTTLVENKEEKTDFTKLQQSLINRYSEISIPQPPGVDRDLPIDDVLIEQEMKRYHDPSNTENYVNLKDIFETAKSQPATRIIVEGDPGFGKTTLSTKLAIDWANGKDYISSRFGLVLLIPLREIKDKRLEDAIVEIIGGVSSAITVNDQNLKNFLEENKALLILDGYDEMTPEGRDRLGPILHKNELKSICILVTSRRGLFTVRKSTRHSSVATLQQTNYQFKFWDSRILLYGLSDDQVKTVLQKHFKIDWDTMKEQIDELFRGQRREIFRCPLLAFWLGLLFENKKIHKIKTRTCFFKALINLIFHKALVLKEIIKQEKQIDIFSEDKLPTTLKNDIIQFGQMALQRLISHEVLFTESDLKCLSNSVILDSELLIKYKLITTYTEEVHYQPMHRTFVEFLAALSVSNGLTEDSNEIISNLVKQQLVPSMNSLFYPFIAGLLDQKADYLFRYLSPWSALYHVNREEMMNILIELTTVTDKMIESLLRFVPSWFEIDFSNEIHKFYSSKSFKTLFKAATKKTAKENSFSVLKLNFNALLKLPVQSMALQTLILELSKDELCSGSPVPNFHCDELVYSINGDFSSTRKRQWINFLKPVLRVEAKEHHLYVEKCPFSSTDILDTITKDTFNHVCFQNVQFEYCSLEDSHLAILSELVRKGLITKSIWLTLYQNTKVTAEAISELWDVVVQSDTINDFSFFIDNVDLKFSLDLKCLEDGKKKSFNKLLFGGNLPLIQRNDKHVKVLVTELIAERWDESLEKRSLNFLECFCILKVLSCSWDMLTTALSNDAFCLTLVQELFLYLGNLSSDSWTALSKMSLVEKMPSLKTLDVDFLYIFKIPFEAQTFLMSVLDLKTLRSLGLHSIESVEACTYLLNLISKAGLNSNCDRVMGILFFPDSEILTELKNGLRQKLFNCLSMSTLVVPPRLLCDVLSVFSEKEFLFSYETDQTRHADFYNPLIKYCMVPKKNVDNRILIKLKE